MLSGANGSVCLLSQYRKGTFIYVNGKRTIQNALKRLRKSIVRCFDEYGGDVRNEKEGNTKFSDVNSHSM